jgi:hypothetical protein
MAITKKTLVGKSPSKKLTKKSTTKATISAAKLATAYRYK